MGNGLFTLADKLQGLNRTLHNQRQGRPDRIALRAGLETHVGEFKMARKMSEQATRDLFGNRPLVGVDGSVNQVGGNYPYTIHLFKSLAKSTLPTGQGETTAEKVSLLSPLQSEDLKEIRLFMEEKRHELKVDRQDEPEIERALQEQQAYFMYADQRMVQMELEVAIEALGKFKPSVMLMDGGFSRLKGKGGDLWYQFENEAIALGTIIVGVIEEVGSYRLQSRLDEDMVSGFVHGHDREILFGTLEQGEWLKTSLDKPIKNDFYTVFTRLSDLPQAGACDFLREQAGQVDEVIDFLYTITPSKSRGIPLWLDLVDAEVRLTKKQVDLIVKSNIDLENMESF
ncbi:MAG: DNA double-strand break repair nuclease NurA, partial [Tumebacillaceae bacterium]